ncbi:MAG: tRNA guanosine(34) transglycosylase Tgt [Planctomycetota bacterium]|nr:tRNA guanosine(34) transglycosylase Tgt [Planctomycetota bacterium]MDG2143129.1 tRNA guanosine(34) transglycosylase Tgt [Planctomycetota bacterium]
MSASQAGFHFEVEAICKKSGARAGRLTTPNGVAQTPLFMPVGTRGTVKGMTPAQVKDAGSTVILANTYHLHLRPGEATVKQLGGLHKFMNWDGPILTDSGGYQVFSMSDMRELNEEGVKLKSIVDGAIVHLTPENVMQIEVDLGADIIMAFDHCPSDPLDRDSVEAATMRTGRWLQRCVDKYEELGGIASGHALFGIAQGGAFEDLRQTSIDHITSHDLFGYAIGGVSVGEHKSALVQAIDFAAKRLPPEKPRYLMGVGTPEDFFEAILRGVDMFDCVTPTRHGRMHQAFTSQGRMNLRNQRWQHDTAPMDPDCSCEACRGFSRGYIRHLAKSGEILGGILISIHNVHFFHSLMTEMRQAIFESNLPDLQERYLDVMTRRI